MSLNAATENAAAVAAPQKAIVIVDDNALIRRLIADFLAEMGYAPTEAASVEEAIPQIQKLRPAMVLMDIVMPGADGVEGLRRIRSDAAVAETPVVAVTSLYDGPSEQDFLTAGFDAYLPKPLDLRHFAEVVRRQIA